METIRQYALGKLVETAEVDRLRDRLARGARLGRTAPRQAHTGLLFIVPVLTVRGLRRRPV